MPDVLLYDYTGSICCQMVRVTLAEKRVAYRKRTIDITGRAEQFEPWYTALNPKAVVPTLQVDDEVVTDTMRICPEIDRRFDGPVLTPAEPARAEAMAVWMRDVMAPHYGVLLYSRHLDADRRSATIIGRGVELRKMRDARPEAAELLDRRLAGNARLQAILADPEQVRVHIDGVQALVERLEHALEDGDFATGPTWTLADAFWTAALARFELHDLETWSGGRLPRVAAYYARLQDRPSWAEAGVVNRGSALH